MRELLRWLMHEDQKGLYELLFAIVLNMVFLALMALLLWPLGSQILAFRMAQGYVIFWVTFVVATMLLNGIHRFFKVNIYDHADAYVNSNVAVSGFLQVGWSAFAALVVQDLAVSRPFWRGLSLYFVGFLSCYITFNIVSSFYTGSIYKTINLPLAFVSFIVFSIWPVLARVTFGQFFQLF